MLIIKNNIKSLKIIKKKKSLLKINNRSYV